MTTPHVASTSTNAPYVAQPQVQAATARPGARSLSTLTRPAQVKSRQSLPGGRSGDALTPTQRSQGPPPTASQRWVSPSGREPQKQAQSVKVVKGRPSGGPGYAFSGSVSVSGSGFATSGGVVGARPSLIEEDGLSRTWQGVDTSAIRTPTQPNGIAREKPNTRSPNGVRDSTDSANYVIGQKAEYFSDNQGSWFECIIAGELPGGQLRVSINGHQRFVLRDKIASHIRAPNRQAKEDREAKELPRAVITSPTNVAVPSTSIDVQRCKQPQVVRPFMPPQRHGRCPSPSPERLLGSQAHQPLRAFAVMTDGGGVKRVPGVPIKSASYVAEPRPERLVAYGTGSVLDGIRNGGPRVLDGGPAKVLNGGIGIRSPVKAGSYVAPRPQETQDTRQTASFTASPMYARSPPGAEPAAAAPFLRMRAVCGAYTVAGHKMRCPGGPNQDCYLVKPLGQGLLLAAVFDGHGAHGHQVSEYVRDLFDRFSDSLGICPEHDLAEGYTNVFRLAQESLENEGLAEMAGTTATVALINANAGILTVAHVGDSTLAVYVGNAVSFKTRDHVVDAAAEEYVRARGGEVRSSSYDGVSAWRIYHCGEDSAGLGMSHALGHTELQPLIQNVPEVKTAQFSPGSTLVIASDGIWEKIPPEELAAIVSAQPPTLSDDQAEKVARTLSAEARQRWCGDIDDITCVVVRAVPDVTSGSMSGQRN